ncbi:hypothetical protein LTR50_002775 [Elasticomyces elasticus]|nr:hypothetical protein LTR50_002775 [Elasticomyces elasticus]
MAIITGYGGVFQETEGYAHAAITIAVQKVQHPQWHQIFLRAVGANWLVSFAVFISISSREISSKIIAIWWPTATFVALALDHVVANMFFIPLGIWCGAPITVGYYIWKSMIPSVLGNMIGGGVFVGAMYWYLYLTGTGGVSVDFNLGSLDTAMEAGGPLWRKKKKGEREGQVTEGLAPNDDEDDKLVGQDSLPHSGAQLTSGIGKELGDISPYAKTHAERMKGGSSTEDEKV